MVYAVSVYATVVDDVIRQYGHDNDRPLMIVSITDQKLYVWQNGRILANYVVSTSKYGIGSAANSNKTPLGGHRIAKRIGGGKPLGMEFRSRQATGRIAGNLFDDPREDVITTRILWLTGLDSGLNKGGRVDSKSRYIYIHGTAQESLLGQPASHGCIRMKNQDVIRLFDLTKRGDIVYIMESEFDA